MCWCPIGRYEGWLSSSGFPPCGYGAGLRPLGYHAAEKLHSSSPEGTSLIYCIINPHKSYLPVRYYIACEYLQKWLTNTEFRVSFKLTWLPWTHHQQTNWFNQTLCKWCPLQNSPENSFWIVIVIEIYNSQSGNCTCCSSQSITAQMIISHYHCTIVQQALQEFLMT